MEKINKNLIFYALGILAILTLWALMMPIEAGAYYEYRYARYNFNTESNNRDLYPEAGYIAYPVNDYQGNQNSDANRNVSTNTTTYTNYTTSDSNTSSAREDTESNNSDSSVSFSDYSNLAANSVFGSHSFMPSGLVQWVILAIFILLIVIFIRRVFGKDEKYYAEPLKHA